MAHHLEDMAILNRQSEVTLTFAIGALSVAFGYLLNVFNPSKELKYQDWHWLVPVLTLNLHLAGVTAYVLIKTMMSGPVMPLGNEPKNLLSPEVLAANLDEIRISECRNQQARIEHNRARNFFVGRALNKARVALLCSPLTFLVAWGVAQAVSAR